MRTALTACGGGAAARRRGRLRRARGAGRRDRAALPGDRRRAPATRRRSLHAPARSGSRAVGAVADRILRSLGAGELPRRQRPRRRSNGAAARDASSKRAQPDLIVASSDVGQRRPRPRRPRHRRARLRRPRTPRSSDVERAIDDLGPAHRAAARGARRSPRGSSGSETAVAARLAGDEARPTSSSTRASSATIGERTPARRPRPRWRAGSNVAGREPGGRAVRPRPARDARPRRLPGDLGQRRRRSQSCGANPRDADARAPSARAASRSSRSRLIAGRARDRRGPRAVARLLHPDAFR